MHENIRYNLTYFVPVDYLGSYCRHYYHHENQVAFVVYFDLNPYHSCYYYRNYWMNYLMNYYYFVFVDIDYYNYYFLVIDYYVDYLMMNYLISVLMQIFVLHRYYFDCYNIDHYHENFDYIDFVNDFVVDYLVMMDLYLFIYLIFSFKNIQHLFNTYFVGHKKRK